MATISENLQIIADSTAAIKQAIIDKGGDVTGDITTWANAIEGISGGGNTPSTGKNDVTFYDYDGTVLHSYAKDDFLALSELPEFPTRQGLICQGWDYNIDDAKSYVSEYGVLNIGAMYITDDGKTRLHIRIVGKGRMTVPLYFSQTVANGVTIDWGDGSATQTLSGTGNVNTSHTYADAGEYTISLNPSSGCTLGLGHNSSSYCIMGGTGNYGKVYCNMLQAVEIGKNVTSIGSYAFYACYSLSSVVIPDSVISIGSYAFNNCYSLSSVVIPQGVASINGLTFSSCYGMAYYDFRTVTSVPTLSNVSAFNNIPSDCKIVVPDSLYDTWIAATNWSTYASYIIKASEFNG